jgi:microcystin-dependent protein
MQVFIGTIETFAFDFAPRNWMQCRGQLMAISQNVALFSLLGTTFGGDGRVTYALPDLRSRVMVNQGQGPGLSQYIMGEQIGVENEYMLVSNMPQHVHGLNASTAAATATTPDGTVVLGAPNGEDADLAPVTVKDYAPAPPTGILSPTSVAVTGNNTPVPVLQPLLTINTSIALYGIFPSRS